MQKGTCKQASREVFRRMTTGFHATERREFAAYIARVTAPFQRLLERLDRGELATATGPAPTTGPRNPFRPALMEPGTAERRRWWYARPGHRQKIGY